MDHTKQTVLVEANEMNGCTKSSRYTIKGIACLAIHSALDESEQLTKGV